MKAIRIGTVLGCLLALVSGAVLAADQPAKKLTCCEQAAAKGKECRHRCCLAAHKEGQSCLKCNPKKEDLALKKDLKKVVAQAKK